MSYQNLRSTLCHMKMKHERHHFFSQKAQREIKTVAVYVSDVRLKTHSCNLGRETEFQI